mmetsp:Transcript_11711/g.33128  ORF Transcript_11711/g.33128 Transcript_11711/m.33128 type:complete len:321 (-) Transcript_11711:884-1846(-)
MADAATAQSSAPESSVGKGLGQLRIGCAGFSNKAWIGTALPKSTASDGLSMLDAYQELFDTVEVNSSFYHCPSQQQIATWKKRCAPGFQMGMKVTQGITHEGRLSSPDALQLLNRYIAAVSGLGDNLGPILFQCPASLKADTQRLRTLRDAVSGHASPPPRIAIEFRDDSWFQDPAALDLLRSANWALCNHPDTVRPAGRSRPGTPLGDLHEVVTADWVYVRLHGDNDEHTYDYSQEELRRYAAAVHKWRLRGLDCYVMFLNETGPPRCAMPNNAREFKRLMHGLANETVPRAPKEPKRTLLSFFQRSPKKAKKGPAVGA